MLHSDLEKDGDSFVLVSTCADEGSIETTQPEFTQCPSPSGARVRLEPSAPACSAAMTLPLQWTVQIGGSQYKLSADVAVTIGPVSVSPAVVEARTPEGGSLFDLSVQTSQALKATPVDFAITPPPANVHTPCLNVATPRSQVEAKPERESNKGSPQSSSSFHLTQKTPNSVLAQDGGVSAPRTKFLGFMNRWARGASRTEPVSPTKRECVAEPTAQAMELQHLPVPMSPDHSNAEPACSGTHRAQGDEPVMDHSSQSRDRLCAATDVGGCLPDNRPGLENSRGAREEGREESRSGGSDPLISPRAESQRNSSESPEGHRLNSASSREDSQGCSCLSGMDGSANATTESPSKHLITDVILGPSRDCVAARELEGVKEVATDGEGIVLTNGLDEQDEDAEATAPKGDVTELNHLHPRGSTKELRECAAEASESLESVEELHHVRIHHEEPPADVDVRMIPVKTEGSSKVVVETTEQSQAESQSISSAEAHPTSTADIACATTHITASHQIPTPLEGGQAHHRKAQPLLSTDESPDKVALDWYNASQGEMLAARNLAQMHGADFSCLNSHYPPVYAETAALVLLSCSRTEAWLAVLAEDENAVWRICRTYPVCYTRSKAQWAAIEERALISALTKEAWWLRRKGRGKHQAGTLLVWNRLQATHTWPLSREHRSWWGLRKGNLDTVIATMANWQTHIYVERTCTSLVWPELYKDFMAYS